ncbi:cysteine peptidase family C39 domain-containing protein [Mycoplasmopsis agalactiae]|uniref:Mbov_0121 family peptidase domain-containing ABC transporter n=1 Tax=Mycoplasmopsis agalactiae TaxID=2110 RepID=UPI00211CEE8B|nr:cysteine peptidase family C39 domain-containing protein [Mycoplasmopsis agalactiae]UUM25643.1 cysteine peptidase family C39 domain-containing protein [Mycoplasmopsis agalactiae]
MRISKQEDQRDCGLHVLSYLINYYHHKEVDINYLKINCSYGKDGISLFNLKSMASENGLKLDSYSGEFDALTSLSKQDLPLILLLNRNGYSHYVVLLKIKGSKFYIQDPELGKLAKMDEKALKEQYANVIALVSPLKLSKEKGKFVIDNRIKSLISNREYAYPLLISTFINLLLSFSSSFFIKIVFDFILPNFLNKTIIVVFTLFVWLCILKAINQYFKSYIVNKITNKIYIKLSVEFFSKLKKTSINNLYKLNNSEYFKRAAYIQYISEFQANFAYTFISEILSLVLSGLLLIWINYLLFALVACLIILVIIANYIYQSRLESLHNYSIDAASKKIQADIDYINSKDNFSDQGYFDNLWLTQYKKTVSQKQIDEKIYKTGSSNNLFNSIFVGNISNIIIFASTFLIIKSKLTNGDMMMFLTSVSFFINPLLSISSLLSSNSIIKKYVNQINFVFNLPHKDIMDNGLIINKVDNIELKSIKFGYEEGINILDFENIKIDQNTCFKGTNGSGKSTLLKLIKGDFDNYTGLYLINGINQKQINFEDLLNNTIYISSDIFIPNMKVIDFIIDNNKEKVNVLNQNIEKYGLINVINKANINMNIEINNNASNLSSGQKQIILLLRLLTRKYKIVMLDEAFENISIDNSAELKKAIKDYQKDALFLEISHSNNFVHISKEIRLNEINNYI